MPASFRASFSDYAKEKNVLKACNSWMVKTWKIHRGAGEAFVIDTLTV